MDMDLTLCSTRSFDDTVASLEREIAAANFKVQAVHDVSATLAEKGFDRERVTILELCNARYASEVLAADIKIGLMLPCPIMVYAERDDVFVSTMKPTLIAGFFPNVDLGSVPAEVEQIILGIMERAAS